MGRRWSRVSSSLSQTNAGTFVPRNFRSRERKFHRVELSLPGTFAPWNFRSRERKFHGTFAPWNFRSLELSLPWAKKQCWANPNCDSDLNRDFSIFGGNDSTILGSDSTWKIGYSSGDLTSSELLRTCITVYRLERDRQWCGVEVSVTCLLPPND